MGSVNEYLNKNNAELELEATAENLTGMINIIEDGTISGKQAKKYSLYWLKKAVRRNKWPGRHGTISDPAVLSGMVTEVLDANEQSVEDYKNGKDVQLATWSVEIMKNQGQANLKWSTRSFLKKFKEINQQKHLLSLRTAGALY